MATRSGFSWRAEILVAGGLAIAGAASGLEIQLPAERAAYPPSDLPGYALVQRNCLLCHSAEYAQYQPPASPRSYWEATVRKMKKPFGAPLAEDDIPAIVDYLVAANAAIRPAPPKVADVPAAIQSLTPAGPAMPRDAQAIITASNCAACHAPDRKVVGPAFRDIAARYAGRSDAAVQIANSIRTGGSGKWGPVPMPPFPGLSDEELKTLSSWIVLR
jgi:sulfite dehydrogenase